MKRGEYKMYLMIIMFSYNIFLYQSKDEVINVDNVGCCWWKCDVLHLEEEEELEGAPCPNSTPHPGTRRCHLRLLINTSAPPAPHAPQRSST